MATARNFKQQEEILAVGWVVQELSKQQKIQPMGCREHEMSKQKEIQTMGCRVQDMTRDEQATRNPSNDLDEVDGARAKQAESNASNGEDDLRTQHTSTQAWVERSGRCKRCGSKKKSKQ